MNNILRDLVSYYIQTCRERGDAPDIYEFMQEHCTREINFDQELQITEWIQQELATTYTLKEEIA